MNRRLLLLTIAVWLAPVPLNAQDRLAVTFLHDSTPATVEPASDYTIALTLRNTGLADWNAADNIGLAYHWVTLDGRPAVREGLRTNISRRVPPGGDVTVCATLRTPAGPGEYQLQWDMVQENVTWFSALSPSNVLTRKVALVAAGGRATASATLTLVSVCLAFVMHLALTTWWAWRCRRHRASSEVLVFQAAVMGLGSLHAVLHVLVFTVGLGVWRTIAGLAGVQGALWAWHLWYPPVTVPAGGDGQREDPAHPVGGPSWQILAVAGWVVVLALLLQWAAAAATGPAISGTDAAHYHVPHAVNFARGVNPFTFVATPHLYPMGTSVWAAWLIQAANGPLLVDLATLPAFLLLAAACSALVHLLGGRPGLAWTPWLVLVIFSSWLLRASIQMSADLFYAAAVVALIAAFAVVWHDRRADTRHLALVALCAGMLVSTKITGAVSLVVVGGLSLLGVGARLCIGSTAPVRLRPRAWLGASILFLASGGVWWLRNWWGYGSPIAPAGLQVFGVTVFKGESYAATRLYRSVLGDLVKSPGYDLWARFADYSAQLMGNWFFPLAFLGVVLVADVLIEYYRHRRLNEPTQLKLLLGLLFVVSFGIHAIVLAGSPWTSLEWTKGMSIRFLLPFFVLWTLLWYSSAFT